MIIINIITSVSSVARVSIILTHVHAYTHNNQSKMENFVHYNWNKLDDESVFSSKRENRILFNLFQQMTLVILIITHSYYCYYY